VTEPQPVRKDELLATLPPEWPEKDLRKRIGEATLASGRKVVVLDDDPTGTQTVHAVPVITEWSPEVLDAAWDDAGTTFFILTNSRCYPLEQVVTMNQEVARNLGQVARQRGVEPIVVSRSDSTLRGHYPGEVSALLETLEAELDTRYDGVVIVPFFLEGGRFTINDVHWVLEGEYLTPAAQTEFARDPTFGYQCSNLREWVAEKTREDITAHDVACITLRDIREGGPGVVSRRLLEVRDRQTVVSNAATYRDVEVLAWALVQLEEQGKRFLFRTAASFVKARGGIPDRGLLTFEELQPTKAQTDAGGLTVVGSYVQRTTSQLDKALELDGIQGVELSVAHALDVQARRQEISRALDLVDSRLRSGQDVILYTSRELYLPDSVPQLEVAGQVSEALVEVLRRLSVRPAYLIGKGGITSSDLATGALGVRKALALGQILPGVPVWRLGPESKYPGLSYVVFPGNVGGADAVAHAIRTLRGNTA
jgi:uncharacterized protein YgbK (DUF1537 family)